TRALGGQVDGCAGPKFPASVVDYSANDLERRRPSSRKSELRTRVCAHPPSQSETWGRQGRRRRAVGGSDRTSLMFDDDACGSGRRAPCSSQPPEVGAEAADLADAALGPSFWTAEK